MRIGALTCRGIRGKRITRAVRLRAEAGPGPAAAGRRPARLAAATKPHRDRRPLGGQRESKGVAARDVIETARPTALWRWALHRSPDRSQ